MQSTEAFSKIHEIVRVWGKEPKSGFVANELSVQLADCLEISVEGRCGRGAGIAIARHNGQIVAHQFSGTFESGQWLQLIERAFGLVTRQVAFQKALPEYFKRDVRRTYKSPLEIENGYLMADSY